VKIIRPLSSKERQRANQEAARIASRMIPLMFVALNDELGIGADRLARVYKRLCELTGEYASDDAGDEKLRRRLDQMKIMFFVKGDPMLSVENYKMFRGTMRLNLIGNPNVYVEGDWLYRPDTDCWYCAGSSYPAYVCEIKEDSGNV